MTREELEALIWDILGQLGNPAKVETILLAADAYASHKQRGDITSPMSPH